MSAANSSGGVMGKMIDAQSIVVASTATNWFGHEGTILRFVFSHSIALACLVGILVMLQAYRLHRHGRALTNAPDNSDTQILDQPPVGMVYDCPFCLCIS